MNNASSAANAVTSSQLASAIAAVGVIAEVVRELGSVPSGHLYAHVMGAMSLEAYQSAIALLKRASLVTEGASHMIRWTGPVLP